MYRNLTKRLLQFADSSTAGVASSFGICGFAVATSKAESSVTQQPSVIVQDIETQKYTPYSREQSPSGEANRFSASQEIHRILCNPKVITEFISTRHLSLS